MWVFWAALLMAGLAAAGYVLSITAGYFLPLPYTVKALLVSELTKLRSEMNDLSIVVPIVPDQCLREIANNIAASATGAARLCKTNKQMEAIDRVHGFVTLLSVRLNPSNYTAAGRLAAGSVWFSDEVSEDLDRLRPFGFSFPIRSEAA